MAMSGGTLTWSTTSVSLAVGETKTVNYTTTYTDVQSSYFAPLVASVATFTEGTNKIDLTGTAAGTVTIAAGTTVAFEMKTTNALTITVTAPVEDQNFLNERGLAHFWENVDALIDNKISHGDVQTSDIADGAVTTDKIAGSAVTTSKIANLAVTANRVADGVLTQDKFNLDKFPAGHLGYYFTSNKTTANSSTGTDLGNAVTITSTIPVRVMFEFSSAMKTSRYTSNVCLKVDGAVVASSGTNSTSFTTIIGRHIMTLSAGSHSVVVAIRSQDSGTTATANSYTSETNGLAWWCV